MDLARDRLRPTHGPVPWLAADPRPSREAARGGGEGRRSPSPHPLRLGCGHPTGNTKTERENNNTPNDVRIHSCSNPRWFPMRSGPGGGLDLLVPPGLDLDLREVQGGRRTAPVGCEHNGHEGAMNAGRWKKVGFEKSE